MKKLLFIIGLGLISGSVYAACVGGSALCYDDTGVTVNGYGLTGNGLDLPVLSSTSINAIGARPIGRTVVCNSCANASGSYALCMATAAVTGGTSNGFVIMESTNGVLGCK